jgi:oligopeptide transport system substrate-binding protein
MAIDQETLANIVLKGFRFPATGGLIPPGIPGHSPGIGLPFDPSKARELLSDAGYPDGSGFPPVDTLSAFAVNPVAHYLIKQWHTTLGIDIPWEGTEWLAYLEKMWEPHHLIIQTWEADYPDPDNLLRVFAKHSWSTWQNVDYGKLVEEARRSTDQERRMRLYRQADKILVEDAALIPLTYDQRIFLIKPWVINFHRWLGWKNVIIEPH